MPAAKKPARPRRPAKEILAGGRCRPLPFPQFPRETDGEKHRRRNGRNTALRRDLHDIVMQMPVIRGQSLPRPEIVRIQLLHAPRTHACQRMLTDHSPSHPQHLQTFRVRIVLQLARIGDALAHRIGRHEKQHARQRRQRPNPARTPPHELEPQRRQHSHKVRVRLNRIAAACSTSTGTSHRRSSGK
jgi:hypothetical protein